MADAPSPSAPKKPPTRRFFWPGGLSARLLILTVLFVAGASAIALPATNRTVRISRRSRCSTTTATGS